MTSNGDPHKSTQDVNESGVGHASRWANMAPAKVDLVAIVKASVIVFVLYLASGIISAIILYRLLPEDVPIDYTIEVPIVLKCFFFFLGLLPNVIGGYFAATFAGRAFLLHAVVLGTVLLAIYGALDLIPSDDPFTLIDGITLLLTVPLAAAGGVIRSRSKYRDGK